MDTSKLKYIAKFYIDNKEVTFKEFITEYNMRDYYSGLLEVKAI